MVHAFMVLKMVQGCPVSICEHVAIFFWFIYAYFHTIERDLGLNVLLKALKRADKTLGHVWGLYVPQRKAE